MRVVLAVLLACLLAPPLRAEESEDLVASGVVRVDVTAAPERPYVGQRATVTLVLKTSRFFRGAPTFRVPDLPGAILRQESAFAVNGSETIEGETFATQSWELTLYAQTLRPIVVPPIAVTMRVAGKGAEILEVAARTASIQVQPRLPEGAPAGELILSARGLTMAASREPEEGRALHVGDALRRTITLTVADAPGMLIPPLPAFEHLGLAVYPDPAQVTDKTDRGSLTGTRVESTSYAFERPGTYELPGYEVAWFDLSTESFQTASVPALTVEVAPSADLAAGTEAAEGDQLGEDTAPSAPPLQWLTTLAGVLSLVAAGWVLWRRYGAAVQAHRAARQRERENSEAAHYKRLIEACGANDAGRAMQRLLAWVDRRAGGHTGSLAAFVRTADDRDLTAAVEDLDAHLYGPASDPEAWRGAALHVALERARARGASTPARDPLPPLNPRTS
ncbi:MAG: hypothetical protein P1V36_02475 [Planctomycetota bacterium]|nr:hypothetical protein [Planctomycetota bacterium]